ncbi:hypothetical protein BKA80DRAFT_305157 [Phyllosticta citrichinensis]
MDGQEVTRTVITTLWATDPFWALTTPTKFATATETAFFTATEKSFETIRITNHAWKTVARVIGSSLSGVSGSLSGVNGSLSSFRNASVSVTSTSCTVPPIRTTVTATPARDFPQKWTDGVVIGSLFATFFGTLLLCWGFFQWRLRYIRRDFAVNGGAGNQAGAGNQDGIGNQGGVGSQGGTGSQAQGQPALPISPPLSPPLLPPRPPPANATPSDQNYTPQENTQRLVFQDERLSPGTNRSAPSRPPRSGEASTAPGDIGIGRSGRFPSILAYDDFMIADYFAALQRASSVYSESPGFRSGNTQPQDRHTHTYPGANCPGRSCPGIPIEEHSTDASMTAATGPKPSENTLHRKSSGILLQELPPPVDSDDSPDLSDNNDLSDDTNEGRKVPGYHFYTKPIDSQLEIELQILPSRDNGSGDGHQSQTTASSRPPAATGPKETNAPDIGSRRSSRKGTFQPRHCDIIDEEDAEEQSLVGPKADESLRDTSRGLRGGGDDSESLTDSVSYPSFPNLEDRAESQSASTKRPADMVANYSVPIRPRLPTDPVICRDSYPTGKDRIVVFLGVTSLERSFDAESADAESADAEPPDDEPADAECSSGAESEESDDVVIIVDMPDQSAAAKRKQEGSSIPVFHTQHPAIRSVTVHRPDPNLPEPQSAVFDWANGGNDSNGDADSVISDDASTNAPTAPPSYASATSEDGSDEDTLASKDDLSLASQEDVSGPTDEEEKKKREDKEL